MATPLETLIEERDFAEERGDLDKVAEMEAMIQLHFKNNPQVMKKGGAVKRNKPKPKKGSTVRGSGIARQGVRKAKIR
tara:strand:- start:4 stop:237 length:234 start_codon:yes stop_codon:yes gene_type:complete